MSLLDLLKPASKETQTARILKHLQKHRRATNAELGRYCQRFGARLFDLRDEGHVIETERLKDGLYLYTYLGHRDDQETA